MLHAIKGIFHFHFHFNCAKHSSTLAMDSMKLEKIESYLLNKMDAETRQTFEQQMAKDSALAKEVKLQEEAYLVLDTLGDQKMKRKLDEIHGRVIGKEKNVNVNSNRNVKRFVLSGVLGLLLIFGLAYYFFIYESDKQNINPPQIYAQYFEPYPINIGTRGDDYVLELQQINTLYSRQEYQKALPIIEKLIETTPNNTKLQLAAGISALQTKQFDKAYQYFNSLIDNNDILYKDKALWFAAMTALQQDNKTLVKQYLQTLLNTPDGFKKEESQKILQLLK